MPASESRDATLARVSDLLRRSAVEDAEGLIGTLARRLPWWGKVVLSDGTPPEVGLKVRTLPGMSWGRYAGATLTITSIFPQHGQCLTVQCGPVQFDAAQLTAAPDQTAPCECRGWKCPNCDPESK